MFNKLRLSSTEDEFNFKRNLKVKGEYLIKQIYDVLLDENKGNEVDWSDILAILKYDKSLRDKLYIFMASFEEYLKSKIFRKYDVSNRDIIYRRKNMQRLYTNIYDKEDKEHSNLYYCFELELGAMIDLMENKQMFEQSYIDRVKAIKNLRNKVMHHQVLLLGKATTYAKTILEIENLQKELETLYGLMPDDGYKETLQKALNDQIGRKYMKKISLEVMVDGIFNKSRS